jgi:hypothetical protein
MFLSVAHLRWISHSGDSWTAISFHRSGWTTTCTSSCDKWHCYSLNPTFSACSKSASHGQEKPVTRRYQLTIDYANPLVWLFQQVECRDQRSWSYSLLCFMRCRIPQVPHLSSSSTKLTKSVTYLVQTQNPSNEFNCLQWKTHIKKFSSSPIPTPELH